MNRFHALLFGTSIPTGLWAVGNYLLNGTFEAPVVPLLFAGAVGVLVAWVFA